MSTETFYSLYLELQPWRTKKKLKPIAICYRERGKQPVRRQTGISVLPENWDNSSRLVVGHSNAEELNKILNSKIKPFLKRAATNEVAEMPVTRDIMGVKAKVDFEAFCKAVRGDNRITATQLNRIKKFHGDYPQLSAINFEWLRKFWAYLTEEMDLHHNTAVDVFEFLRRILNVALAEKKILEQPMSSSAFRLPKKEDVDTVYLDDDELKRVVDWVFAQPLTRNDATYCNMVFFALACHVGYRHSDWHKISPDNPPYKEGSHWFFKVRATKNGKSVVVPVGETVRRLYARAVKIKPVGDVSDAGAQIKAQCKALNINKDIATHVGRHTCGRKIASSGMSEETCAEILGIGKRMVKVYYHLTGQAIIEQAKPMAEW